MHLQPLEIQHADLHVRLSTRSLHVVPVTPVDILLPVLLKTCISIVSCWYKPD